MPLDESPPLAHSKPVGAVAKRNHRKAPVSMPSVSLAWLETERHAERDASTAEASAAPDPPNLKGTAFARTDSRVELDLKDLDRFHNSGKDDA